MTGLCPCQQRPSDYGIPMDVEMAYVQDNFLTNDILHEMVSSLPGGEGGALGPQLDGAILRDSSEQGSDSSSAAETQVPDSCPPAPATLPPTWPPCCSGTCWRCRGLAPLHLPLIEDT